MGQSLELPSPDDCVAEEDGEGSFVDPQSEVGQVVEPVDPDELGEGVGHAVAAESQTDQDHPDLEKVLEAVDSEVQAAPHALGVPATAGEAVEDGNPMSEEGPAQEGAVESAGVDSRQELSDVPGTAVGSSEGNSGDVCRQKAQRFVPLELQVALSKLETPFLGLV